MTRKHTHNSKSHIHRFFWPFIILSFVFLAALSLLFSQSTLTTHHSPPTTNLSVPEIGSRPADPAIAIPRAVEESSPGGKLKIRHFFFAGSHDTFSPNTILVYTGDIVKINISAAEKDYAFALPALGIYQTVVSGRSKQVEFQTTAAGTFPIFCPLCSNPNQAKGTLVVKAL